MVCDNCDMYRCRQETAAALERGVWLLRRAAGTLCLLLLAGAVYRYRDINAANNRLLQELHKQHVELRRCLAANGRRRGIASAQWPMLKFASNITLAAPGFQEIVFQNDARKCFIRVPCNCAVDTRS